MPVSPLQALNGPDPYIPIDDDIERDYRFGGTIAIIGGEYAVLYPSGNYDTSVQALARLLQRRHPGLSFTPEQAAARLRAATLVAELQNRGRS